MAGQGRFRVQSAAAGTNISEPFGEDLFFRLLITNQDTTEAAEVIVNGESDNIAPGEQVEYFGESTLFRVENMAAGGTGVLIVRAFT